MSALLKKVSQASREQWLEYCCKCPYTTYFHTPYWYELLVPDQEICPLLIEFTDGARVLLPFVKVRRFCGLIVDHFSSPGGNYGGWLANVPLKMEQVKALLSMLLEKKNLVFRENPFDSSIAEFNISGSSEDYTYIVDLSQGMDQLYRTFTRGHKNAVNKAAKEGLVVRPAEVIEDWKQYYSVYESTLSRWKRAELKTRTIYSWEFFRRVYDQRTGHEILWLVYKENVPVAGSLAFYWNRHVVAWHGAASGEHFNLRPNNLLYWKIFCDAAQRGFDFFDFNPSGGYSGVESFKEHFGAKRKLCRYVQTRTFLRSMLSKVKR